jgi:hypothetical protein
MDKHITQCSKLALPDVIIVFDLQEREENLAQNVELNI